MEGKPLVEVYADGSCLGNPGPGGYAAVICYGNGRQKRKVISGNCEYTTNNRMELTAVIEALACIEEPSLVIVKTDSKYVVDGITRRIKKWIDRRWRTSTGKEVSNRDLWEKLYGFTFVHEVFFEWIPRNTHYNAALCDNLARKRAMQVASKNGKKRLKAVTCG